MHTIIPEWGSRGCPILPESLRQLWADETLPHWLAAELGMEPGATLSALGASAWDTCRHEKLPQPIQKFLLSLITTRRASIAGVQALARPWPKSLDPSLLTWSNRTRNCLQKAGILTEPSRLSSASFGELLSLKAFGAASALDFSCVVEAAVTPSSELIRAGLFDEDDPSALMLEAIDASWSAQLSSQDPRFSDIVATGHLTVFERLEQLTIEPEDPPLAERQMAKSLAAARVRRESIAALPLEAALTEFVAQLTGYHGTRLRALSRRLGTDGSLPATLEEAATLLGLTRERMRQLQRRFTDRLPTHQIFMPQLDAAIRTLRAAAPIPVDQAAALLQTKGISAGPFDPKSLLAAAEFCGRSEPFEIESSVGIPRVVVETKRELERAILSIACRQAQASGATNVQDVAAELSSRGQSNASPETIRQFLRLCPGVEFIGDDWLWQKDGVPDRNRLRNITRKMLSVTSPVSVSEVREGVHRHYRIRRTRGISDWPLVTPPRAVLQEFYRAHPEFSIDSTGLVGSVGSLEYASELNSTERVLVDALKLSPACLLDRSSLNRSCVGSGMNPNTFSQYLSSSPVIAHIGPDMWSLRGAKVDAASVEALRQANAARPNERRIIDHGWTERGELWLAARLPENVANFVLGIPAAIRRFVLGREFPATDENAIPAGAVRINEQGVSYGYGPFLVRRGADADDILLVTFRLPERTSSLRLIDDEELEAISPAT